MVFSLDFRYRRFGPNGPPKNKSNIERAVAVTCYHQSGATGRPKLRVDFGAQGGGKGSENDPKVEPKMSTEKLLTSNKK